MASRKSGVNADAEKKVRWYHKLRDKYRLIILNEDTFEEKLSFRLSRLNVFVVTGMLAIILVFLTSYLIAFTPLREYIPGYKDTNIQKDLYELQLKSDSIEQAVRAKDLYINNMRRVLLGEEPSDISAEQPKLDSVGRARYAGIDNKKSKDDSLLRAEYEAQNLYNLKVGEKDAVRRNLPLSKLNFFTPLKGSVTNKFNASQQHYGVDIAAARNEAVKSTYDGTVIFSEWTAETGHVIAIQHAGNVVSVYKHNSVLLRKQGAFVKAGESIAIVGESGEYSTGPHLHFELWINGSPVDPENYMVF
ncbi:MAG: M23 family metallopeptidase [Lentimicrobiaceae bacterium]|nr:M23 family metallopeptidase [Lentimicrobiaceae bacterium]MCO5264453.1 M23 family metallopeptidase [Lentimicrobium sp.]HPG32806.1 M23 family metallopeptidase [Lentimicrobium sp.]